MSMFREQFDKMKEILDSKDRQISQLSDSLKAALDLIHSKDKQLDSCIESMQDAVDKLNAWEKADQAYNAVIGYMLGDGYTEEPLQFLRCWNEGDSDVLREGWPDAPKEIYYADPLYKGE